MTQYIELEDTLPVHRLLAAAERSQRTITWSFLAPDDLPEDLPEDQYYLSLCASQLARNCMALQTPWRGHLREVKDRDDYIDDLHCARRNIEVVLKELARLEVSIRAMPPTFNDDGTEYINPLLPEEPLCTTP